MKFLSLFGAQRDMSVNPRSSTTEKIFPSILTFYRGRVFNGVTGITLNMFGLFFGCSFGIGMTRKRNWMQADENSYA